MKSELVARIDVFDDSEEVAMLLGDVDSYITKEAQVHILGLWDLAKSLGAYVVKSDGEFSDRIHALTAERDAAIKRADDSEVKLAKVDEELFIDAVWSALKSDATDLRKQQKILKAFRNTIAELKGQTNDR